MLRINDIAPDFVAETTLGRLSFHEWLGSGWGILFSHPKDFTPVCTTELSYMAEIYSEFERRNCKIIGISVDSLEDHRRWLKDIEDVGSTEVRYPLIADTDLAIAKLYGMLPAEEIGDVKDRTAVTNATVRSVFMIAPDKKINLIFTYPMTVGRNFDEVLRALDALQLTAKFQLATPVNWKRGDKVIIPPSVSNEEAKEKYKDGWETVKDYLRRVEEPTV